MKIESLKAGDRTPWYEVREDAEPDPERAGIIRVLVRHFDNGATDYIRGTSGEEVPRGTR